MGGIDKERLRRLHQVRRSEGARGVAFIAAFAGCQGIVLVILARDWSLWLGVPFILVLGHLMHSFLLAFHEASHGTLRSKRWLNEVNGFLLGVTGFISLSLYRAAHHSHHAYLGTARDEELWPFVDPATPRWFRRLAAFCELVLSPVFTPLLFLRSFLRPGTSIRNKALRRRIWIELSLLTAIVSAVVGVTAWWGLWKYFLVMLLVPGIVGSMLQSWRKYIEHMGLTGSTALSLTRSIVPTGPVGQFLAASMFYEPYHGVHHKYPRLQGLALPEAVEVLTPASRQDVPPFPTYRQALWDMLANLADPRIGPQWRSVPSREATNEPAAAMHEVNATEQDADTVSVGAPAASAPV